MVSPDCVHLLKTPTMKRSLFQLLASVNKVVLPSYTRRRTDLARASKLQLAIIGWRAWVTKRAINQ